MPQTASDPFADYALGAAYDEAFAGVATAFSGLLLLAGHPELAERVKPSPRRPGQTAAEAHSEGTTPASPPEIPPNAG